MATKFDVDFSEALRQLTEFQAKTKALGAALDKVQAASGKPAGAAGTLMKEMHKHFSDLEKSLNRVGIDAEAAGEIIKRSRNTAQGLFTKLAADNLLLTTRARAYNGELKELERLLKDSDAKSSFIKWSQKVNNLQAEMSGQNRVLKASFEALGTAVGRDNLILKERLATATRMATAEHRQVMTNKELKQQLDLLNSTFGRANTVLQAKIANTTKELQEDTKLLGKLGELRRAYDGLNGGLQAQIAAQNALNQGLAQSATFRQREQNQVDELRRKHESLNGGLAEQAAQLRVLNAAREREVTELTRERVKIEELQRSLASLNGGEQEQIARLNAKIAARRRQIQEDGRAAVVMEELSATAARLIVADQRQKAAIDAKNRATIEQARSLQMMTQAEAEAIARSEALAAANKKQSDRMLDEARAAHGLSKAQKELNHVRQQEIDRLERLKAQRDMISGSYGRELAQTRRQIAEQERYNRLLAMTTAELLGLTSAQRKFSAAQAMGSQSAAMMRAGLAGLHTSIGMYTSATIVAASATYAVTAALRSSVKVGAEFSAMMARTDAIMSTSRPAWMPDTGSMAAMETQVRALGQSTAYTASEVAQGLNELGMAGLSAGDAVLALRPSLDLAMIGNISMGQSADIATNVMMTFGKTAGDLTEVVDVMATAVTNSNTTIEQLANSLTYAGPAAQTAGISMRDTVAAIEAMANSGIKSSRSGTALRRLFVSLLNPTAKGAAMMEQYGISVLDAEGKTRGLVDIIGQLNKALAGVSGAERLGAIQDLVGVYATSPVAALVDQADNLAHLRSQLDNVAGAAERMRDKIEDTLSKDWNQVVSAFQEVQLTAFDAYEMRMREGSARLAKWLVDLTEPIETLADGSTISQLDLLLQRAENLARVLGWAAVGFAALKAAAVAGNLAGAMAGDARKLVDVMAVLSGKIREAKVSYDGLSASSMSAAAKARLTYAAVFPVSAAMDATAASARGAATAVGALSVAATALSRALGWVGLIWGIYEAGKAAFGSDARQDLIDQRGEVDNLKSSYEQLKEEMEKISLEKEKNALRGNVAADEKSVQQLLERNKGIQASLDVKDSGLDPDSRASLEAMIAANNHQIALFQKNIEATNKKLAEMGSTALDSVKAQEAQIAAAQRVAETYQAVLDARATLESRAASGTPSVADVEALKAAEKAWKDALQAASQTSTKAVEVKQNLVALGEIAASDAGLQEGQALAKQLEKSASATQRLATARGDLLRIDKEIQELSEQDAKAIEGGGKRPGQDTYNRLRDQRAEAVNAISELQAEADSEAQALADNRRALEDYYRNDAENLAVLKEDLADVMLMRVINNHLIAEGGQLGADASVAESERLKRELELRQRIDSLQERINKPAAKPKKSEAEAELERNLKTAQSSYDALRKQMDPLSASMDEVNEKTAQLALLHKHGKITAEEKAKAIWQLRKAHYELTVEQNANYQSLENLRESYLDSPFSDTLADMTELNRLLRENNVSLEEYRRIKESIGRKAVENATNGLPTANLQVGEASSSPFSDWMSTEIERAQGMSQFGARKEDLFTGYENDVDRIHKEFEARQAALDAEFLQESEHAERLKQLEQEKNAALLAAHNQFGEASKAIDKSRADYSEQMGTMVMISMLGTAENILGMFASVGEDATAAQKAAFVAQKALAIAQIILYTELAAAQVAADMTIPFFGAKVAAASAIRAQGYASAGLVAGLAIAQVAGAGTGGGSSSGSSYSGAYDDGGFIPYNSYGIVGEYGPEIVHGPANVTSREKSAKKLSGGNPEYNITLAPQITVQTSDSQGSASSETKARELANTLRNATLSTLKEQTRPGGLLDTWLSSKRRA